MMRPAQGDLDLLNDAAAMRLLKSTEVAHLAYAWSDGTPRCVPIWFHWSGTELVMSSPSISPKTKTIDDGTPVAVTIDSAEWPYAALMLRGRVRVDEVEGIAPEYPEAAHRYFGDEQGEAWCGHFASRHTHDPLPDDAGMGWRPGLRRSASSDERTGHSDGGVTCPRRERGLMFRLGDRHPLSKNDARNRIGRRARLPGRRRR